MLFINFEDYRKASSGHFGFIYCVSISQLPTASYLNENVWMDVYVNLVLSVMWSNERDWTWTFTVNKWPVLFILQFLSVSFLLRSRYSSIKVLISECTEVLSVLLELQIDLHRINVEGLCPTDFPTTCVMLMKSPKFCGSCLGTNNETMYNDFQSLF